MGVRRWFRSAASGRFSTRSAAETHPAAYVREYARAEDPELVAQSWHEALQRLGPEFVWETVPSWEELPYDNRRLLVAVAKDLQDRGVI